MFGWLRALRERRRRVPRDPAGAVAHEVRQADAMRALDRIKNHVLETDQHIVTRGGGGGPIPPP